MLTEEKLRSFLLSDDASFSSFTRMFAKMMEMKNDRQQTPLHVACMDHEPARTIQLLAEAFPEACTSLDSQQLVPLEYLFYENKINTPDLQGIDALLQVAPQAVITPGDNGDTAFLIACSQRPFPRQVVRKFLRACPEAARSMTRIRETALYSLFWRPLDDTISLDVVKQLFNAAPWAISLPETEHNYLPLHMACYHGSATVDIIRYLVEQYPAGVRERTAHGELPVHLAANSRAPSDVIAYLIDESPKAVLQTNNDGCNLLHLFCASGRPLNSDDYLVAINRLLDYAPLSTVHEDGDSKTPLEYVEEDCPEACVRRLEEAEREATCAVLECALGRLSIMPQSTRQELLARLPAELLSASSNSIDGASLFKSLHDQSLEWYRQHVRPMIRSVVIQAMLKKESFQEVVCAIIKLNRSNRRSYLLTNPSSTNAGVRVMSLEPNNLDFLLLHLVDSPSVCEVRRGIKRKAESEPEID